MGKQLDMNRYRIERYNFIDVDNAPIVLSFAGYNYMSIVTNGAINPNANYYEPSYPQFWFEIATDPFRYLINNEIRNFKLPKWFKKGIPEEDKIDLIQPEVKFYNRKRTGAIRDAETGHGQFYIIFSEEPIENWFMKKHNPHVCIDEIIPFGTTVTFWCGVDKDNVNYPLLIPYIPIGYKYLNYLVTRQHADVSVVGISWYMFRECLTWLDNNAMTVDGHGHQMIAGGDRFAMFVQNTSVDTDYWFRGNLFFTLKSDYS